MHQVQDKIHKCWAWKESNGWRFANHGTQQDCSSTQRFCILIEAQILLFPLMEHFSCLNGYFMLDTNFYWQILPSSAPQLTLLINPCIPVKPTRESWFQMVCVKHLYFSLAALFSHCSCSSGPNEKLKTTPWSFQGGHTRAHTGAISCLWSGQRPDPQCPHPLHINAKERTHAPAHTHTHAQQHC